MKCYRMSISNYRTFILDQVENLCTMYSPTCKTQLKVTDLKAVHFVIEKKHLRKRTAISVSKIGLLIFENKSDVKIRRLLKFQRRKLNH